MQPAAAPPHGERLTAKSKKNPVSRWVGDFSPDRDRHSFRVEKPMKLLALLGGLFLVLALAIGVWVIAKWAIQKSKNNERRYPSDW